MSFGRDPRIDMIVVGHVCHVVCVLSQACFRDVFWCIYGVCAQPFLVVESPVLTTKHNLIEIAPSNLKIN